MTAYPELLAPAGSMTALHAAVRAGANAVYLGLSSFNARRGADNFTLETLEEACRYAHLRGVSVYVALNTIVLPHEMDDVLELARQAWRAGADAFIVQDIGLAAELTRTLPQARLHISTQMNIHNLAGIHAAAKLGASRVTLARELSVAEIALLVKEAAALGLEVEAFCHGALCICYSGQCYMSSMIGGRSANRGQCAQACRLPYTLRNAAQRKDLPSPGEHLLSPRDLCTIDDLPQLVEAGVASLKIEGRMKSPEYVFEVVSAYRAQLDRVLAERRSAAEESSQERGASGSAKVLAASDQAKQALEEVFSRGFTTAYLHGNRGNAIMSYGRPNNRGVLIGRVASVGGGSARVALERDLSAGDILEFWTGRGHFSYKVDHDMPAAEGAAVLHPDKPVAKGDRVFRVRSAALAFEDDALSPRIEVDGRAVLRLGEPLRVEFWRATEDAVPGQETPQGVAQGPVVEPARTKPVTPEDVRAHIDRLGQTPYTLRNLEIAMDEGVGIGFSALHKVRAAALDNLTQQLLAPYENRRLNRIEPCEQAPVVPAQGMKIAAWATNPACARAAKRAGADIIYVPVLHYKRGEASVAGQRSQTAESAGYPKQAVLAVPVIEHDALPETREGRLAFDAWEPVRAGKPVLVESIGALWRASEEGALPEVGPHLPLTNALALQTAAAWGATRAWLSPELTLRQMADLAKDAPLELGVLVGGAQELMVTEHCLLMSQGPCNEDCAACPRRKSPHFLRDRKGYEFPVITDALGRSHLYNAVELDGAPAMVELMSAGIDAVMVDTTLMNVEQTTQAVKRLVRARSVAHADGNPIAKLEGATTGHLYRGVG